jgi:long-chain acyl-CoA synthetase
MPTPEDRSTRLERHFDDRVIRCFAQRPSGPHEMFEQARRARPDAEAIVAGDLRLTYAALDARASDLAAAFAAAGTGVGDRIALLLGNRVEFVTAFLAALRLGAIIVPIGTRLQAPEVAYIVAHCGAKILIHEADLAARVPSSSQAPALVHRISVGATPGSATPGGATPGGEPFEAWAARGQSLPGAPVAAAQEEAVAAIMYTSGTTGKPKGAMITRLNFVHSMLNYRHQLEMGPEDRSLMAVPISHITGLVANLMLTWAAGCTLILMAEFKAGAFLELAARERMTQTVMVPAIYHLCLLQPDFDRHDLSAWRIGGYGGAPMAEATISQLSRRLPGLGLMNIYGATETTSPVCLLAPRYAATHPDSVGQALPCTEMIVMDDEGNELPPAEPGELWIRGPMVVPGYWADEAATRSGFVAGFWRSGDVGSIDARGFVRVFDRKKDMLNRGGFKIYSVEVENVLLEHPDVIEGAVIGRPCPVLGERVHAFVCIGTRAAVDADGLRRFCAERLADYKVPETYTLVTTPLPRNANGKLLKRAMRDQLLADAPGFAPS